MIILTDDYSPLYVGDTGISFAPQFLHQDGSAVNLSGLSISMKMGGPDGEAGPDGAIKICGNHWTIDDAVSGLAHYQWQATDVDTPGDWWLYITLTDSNNRPVHGDVKPLRILAII